MSNSQKIITLIAGCLSLLMTLPASSATLSPKQLARFDTDGDKNVDPDKATIYVRHLYDKNNILADYDDNLNGKIDAEELVRINLALMVVDTQPVSAEVRLRAYENVPIPLQRSPASLEVITAENIGQFYLREKRIELGIDTDRGGYAATSGAAISVTNDFNGSDTNASVKAAFGFLYRNNLDFPDGYQPGETALTAVSFGPYVEGRGQLSSTDSRLEAGAMVQAEILGGPFDLQRLSIAPYFQTDFRGESSIYGGTASWQPILLNVGLGSLRRGPGGLFDYTWAISGEVDYRHVKDAGTSRLTTGDEYAWLGTDASVRAWVLPKVFDSRLFVGGNLTYFSDLISNNGATKYSGEIGFILDANNTSSINFEYINGEDYKTLTKQEFVKTTFKIRF